MSGGSGFRALGLETRVRRLGPERVAGRLYHLGDYPGLITGRHGLVQGEIFSFRDPRLIEELDAYELFDADDPRRSEYRRIEVDLLGSGKRAWTYEYNRSVKSRPIIATGNWRTR
ncbi:MAG: gamma-glutamylcyclotransferase [Sphingomonadales bacterium]|nr:gamma-glutamylcyclotransferase [Sphingomonadales bacterium]